MNTQATNKRLIVYALWYVGIAWALVWMYYLVQGAHLASWPELHKQLLNGVTNDSNQFRLFAFWIPELIHRLFHVDIVYAYLINRFIWTLLTLVLFHAFLLKWFNQSRAWLSTMLFSLLLVFSYLPLFQESDIMLYVIFLLGLFAIRSRKYWWLLAVVALGVFFKETIIFLVPLFMMVEIPKLKPKKAIIKSFGLIIAWLVVFLFTRSLYPGNNSSLWQLPHNLSVFKELFSYPLLLQYRLLWIPVFGILWVVSFFDRSEKPQLLALAGPFGVFVLAVVLVVAWPEESRLLIPTAFLAIPSAMLSLESKSR